MFWWNQSKQKQTPPANRPVPAYTNPQMDLESFGPVVRQNHVAYVPAKSWSMVPGVGTGNLAYVPDFLLSAPEALNGNGYLRVPNSITVANRPAMIRYPKTTLEGIGGLVAGQIIHQPLLEVDVDNDASLGE